MDELHRGSSRRGVVTQLPAWMWLVATVIAIGLVIWCATHESWAGLVVSVAVAIMCGYAWRARSRGTTTN
jgi:hypothetical protein